jgi:hypothetical protein
MKEVNEIKLKNRYGISWDINVKSIKDYFSCNTIDGLQEKINQLKEIHNNNHIYQVIKKQKCKLYIDIDSKDNGYTKNETDDIINMFIHSLNKCFNTIITINDLIIHYWEKDSKIRSIHIICKTIITDKYNMELFRLYILKNYDLLTDTEYDNKVYGKNQLFRMKDMKKMGKDDYTILTDYLDNDYKLSEELIDNTKNIKPINIIDTIKCELEDINRDNEEQKLLKELKCNEEKKSDIFNITELNVLNMYKLITDMKNYNDSWSWKILYHLFNKFGVYDNNSYTKKDFLNEYLIESSNKSNEKYSYEDNLKYVEQNSKQDEDIFKNWKVMTFIRHINNKDMFDYTLDYSNRINIDETLILWIYELINKSVSIIDLHKLLTEYKIKKKNNFIEITEDIYFDLDCSLLYVYGTIHNYNEEKYKSEMEKDEIKYEYHIYHPPKEKLNSKYTPKELIEIQDRVVNELIDSYGRALWGVGKSYKDMKPTIKKYRKKYPNDRICILTENNTLNIELYEDLKQDGFVNHLNTKDINSERLLICSLESYGKLDKTKWNFMILDELETIRSHIESETIKSNYNDSVKTLTDKLFYDIKNSDIIKCLDADLSKKTIDLIQELRPNKKYLSYKYHFNPYINNKFNHYINSDTKWRKNLYNKILNDKNVVLSFTHKSVKKSGSEYVMNDLYSYCLDKKIETIGLCVDGNGGHLTSIKKCIIDGREKYVRLTKEDYIFNGEVKKYESDDILKRDILVNVDKFIVENKIKILGYSPTFKTGISIKLEDYFDSHFSYGKCGSVNVRTYLQSLFRVRHIGKNNTGDFHIYIENRLNNYNGLCEIDKIGEYLSNIAVENITEIHIILK